MSTSYYKLTKFYAFKSKNILHAGENNFGLLFSLGSCNHNPVSSLRSFSETFAVALDTVIRFDIDCHNFYSKLPSYGFYLSLHLCINFFSDQSIADVADCHISSKFINNSVPQGSVIPTTYYSPRISPV